MHKVGQRVSVYWPGDDAWYDGTIASYASTRHGQRVRIDYDDGEKERNVEKKLVRSLEKKSSRSKSPSKKSKGPKEGQKCEAQFKGKGKFYPGRIAKVNSDGTPTFKSNGWLDLKSKKASVRV